MARRRVIVALGCLALATTGVAGLSLAQDQNQTGAAVAPPPDEAAPLTQTPAPPAPVEAPPANAVSSTPVEASPAPLDGPAPVVEAPVASAPPANVAADAGPPPPPRRPRYPVVVLQALDKATAETLRFEARVGEPIRYKDLVIVPHACETQASDEPYTQTAANLEVQFQPQSQPLHGQSVARQVFQGWMFADSPGLHPFEHPTYDLWVIACKAASPAPAPPAAGVHL